MAPSVASAQISGRGRNVQLAVREVAKLLGVSEKTIYRWVRRGSIPAYRVNEQYRFNRAELLEWATSRKISVTPQLFAEPDAPVPTLLDAIQAGGITYRVGGDDKESALRSAVEVMRLPDEVDRMFLLQVLLAREALASTAIGGGIAVPHARNPVVLHVPRPMVSLCFLETPVPFGALDGKPVEVLFLLVSPSMRGHLHLLSLLSFAIHDERFRDTVSEQASRDEIYDSIRRVEASFGRSRSASRRGDR